MHQLGERLSFTEMFCLAGCEDQIVDLLIKNPQLRGMLIVIDARTGEEMTLDLNHANEPSLRIGKSKVLLQGRAQHMVFSPETIVYFKPISKYQAPVIIESGTPNIVISKRPGRTLLFMADGLKALKLKNDTENPSVPTARLHNGEMVELILTHNGTVGYKKGTSIKLLPEDAVLTEETDLLFEFLVSNARAELNYQGDIETLRQQVSAQQFAAILGGAAARTTRDMHVKDASESDNIVAVAVTDFRVEYASLPVGNYDMQGRIFYKAALNSIEDRKRELEAAGQRVMRIESTGNVVPRSEVTKAFEKRIISNGSLSFKVTGAGQTFQKYIIGRDYKVKI